MGVREEERVLGDVKRGLRRIKGITFTKLQTGSSVCIGPEGPSQLVSLTAG